MLRLSGSAQCLPAAPNGSSQGLAPCPPGAQQALLGTAAYLLVQPQELAVAHSAVQHPVHMDVVGLQGETSVRSQHPRDGRASGPAQLRAHRPPQGEAPAGPSPATAQEEVMFPRTLPRGRWGTPSPPRLPAKLSSCPRKHWDPPGTLACPVLSWAPLRELGLPCRHWPQPGGTNPSSHLDPLQALPQSTQLRSTSLAGLGPSPALGGSTPSSPESGRAHTPQGCPWSPMHGTRSPRQAQPQPPAQPGPAGAAVGSQGLHISK